MPPTDSNLLRNARILTGPWIFYDGTCSLCIAGESRLGSMMRRRNFRLATLQSDIARQFITDSTDEMKVITRSGRILGGAEGFAYICRHIWWARPYAWLWHLKFARPSLIRAYEWIAAHRHLVGGACQLPQTKGAHT